MESFSYSRAISAHDAALKLGQPGAVALGGGTDLLALVDEGLARPTTVVDLRHIPGSDGIRELTGGGLAIGASARLADIASNALVRTRYPALALACDAVGSPALRNMGTLGGNLCQRPRCWYYRRNIPCFKHGADTCPAVEGENQYLAILDGGPCYVVHPSDPAVALVALEATAVVMGPRAAGGAATERRVPLDQLFVLPGMRMDRETDLNEGEFILGVELPAVAAGGRQMYRKLMQREAWDFALVSIAAVRRADGEVRIVLGGVAPRPWRVNSSVEEDVASGGLDEDSIAALSERALYDAVPMSKNGYKVDLAASLLRDAMTELVA